MDTIDLDKHVFEANERSESLLSFVTVACVALIGLFGVLIFSMLVMAITLERIGFIAALTVCVIIIILNLESARNAYRYALDTQVEIDPVNRHFVYTHNGQTIEFDGSDVQVWYDNIGLKIGLGKLSRLTEHDSVFVLKSGEVIYLHGWLWDGDYSWSHADGDWEHNIKFYLEAHHEQLDLPTSKTAWTYKYMFP